MNNAAGIFLVSHGGKWWRCRAGNWDWTYDQLVTGFTSPWATISEDAVPAVVLQAASDQKPILRAGDKCPNFGPDCCGRMQPGIFGLVCDDCGKVDGATK